MNKDKANILLIEDHPGETSARLQVLSNGKTGVEFNVTLTGSLTEATGYLLEKSFDAVLLDLCQTGKQELKAVRTLHQQARTVPIVVISDLKDGAIAIKAIQEGAQDYLIKSQITAPVLARSIRFAIERVRTQKRSQENEAQFRALFEQAAVGAAEIDNHTGRFVHINRHFCDLLDRTEAEMMKATIQQITHPEDFQAELEHIERLVTGQIRRLDIERRCLRKDGTIIWVTFSVSPLCHAGEQPEHSIVIVQDITERKRVEGQLRQEQILLRTVINHLPDAIYVKDLDGRKILTNPADIKMMGLHTEIEALGKNDFDVYSKNIAENFFTDDQRVLTTGQARIDVEEKVINYRGQSSWLLTSKLPLHNDQGEIIGLVGIGHDISGRKQIEEALNNQIYFLQVLIDAIPVPVFYKDLEGKYLGCNSAYLEFVGVTKQNIIGRTAYELYPRDVAQTFTEMDLALLQQPGTQTFETSIENILGARHHVIFNKATFFDTSMKPAGLVGTILDISVRKQMEDELKQRLEELGTVDRLSKALRVAKNLEEMFPILLDETLDVLHVSSGSVYILDSETRLLRQSTGLGWFERIAKIPIHPDDGIIGHVFSTGKTYVSREFASDPITNPHLLKEIPVAWGGACLPIRTGDDILGVISVSAELPHVFNENEVRVLNIIATIAGNAIHRARLTQKLQQTNGNLQYEVELRTLTEELLAKEKEFLSTTLLSIGDGVISIDDQKNIFLFNKAAEEITGYATSEIVGRSIEQVIKILDPHTNQAVPNVLAYLSEFQENVKDDPKLTPPLLVTAGGKKVIIEFTISPVCTLEGAALGNVIIFKDITHKLLLDEQSALSQKMEAIGQLATGIAHEINTPIQYVGDNISFFGRAFSRYNELIDTYLQWMRDHQEAAINDELIQSLEYLKDQKKINHYAREIPIAIQESLDGIERVRKIVLAIREFSHPSDKEKKLADINQAIQTTVTISRNEWKYVADLETDLEPDLPFVYCQIDELNQVILNIIVNAAQAIQEVTPKDSDQKGKIHIQTSYNDHHVIISIRDTGCGIPEEIRSRIFDPFFTTKDVGKGTGQGLSIVHNIIVKKHKGMIHVDSQFGKGTTFMIELPINTPLEGGSPDAN